MTEFDKKVKRGFDIVLSFSLLIILFPVIVASCVAACIDTKTLGLFRQQRVGLNGKMININKIKTMKIVAGINTTVSTSNDSRITKLGSLFRKTKIDELPQLWNVLIGDMSFVGPRPDVSGYADKLCDADKIILSVRPGITGPASIKYKNEEELLAIQLDPQQYNDDVIWPDKVRINSEYIRNYSFMNDIKYIWKTIK